MTGVALVHQLVSSGRITPQQGAELLEFRRAVQWRRKPWWERLLVYALAWG